MPESDPLESITIKNCEIYSSANSVTRLSSEPTREELLKSLRWAMTNMTKRTKRRWLDEDEWEDICLCGGGDKCKPDCPWLLAMQRAGLAKPSGRPWLKEQT